MYVYIYIYIYVNTHIHTPVVDIGDEEVTKHDDLLPLEVLKATRYHVQQ